jgi:hypothetical protein
METSLFGCRETGQQIRPLVNSLRSGARFRGFVELTACDVDRKSALG